MQRLGKRTVELVLATAILTGGSPLLAADPLASTLLGVLQAQADAISRGNADDALKTMHSQSPAYASGAKILRDTAGALKVHAEVSDCKLVGIDGDYAFARCSQKITKVSGPEFHDNVRDVLEVFKKEDGAWKEWSSALLTARYLD